VCLLAQLVLYNHLEVTVGNESQHILKHLVIILLDLHTSEVILSFLFFFAASVQAMHQITNKERKNF